LKSAENFVDLPANVSMGVLRRKVWQLAWPSIGEFSLLLAIGLSDVFLIGHISKEAQQKLGYDNASALAATSAGQFFNWTMNAVFMAISIAATTLVARSIGSGDRPRAAIFARHAILLAIGTGLIMTVLALFGGKAFIFLLGAEGQLVDLGYLYLGTTAFGLVFNALLVSSNGAIRGSGDTRTPLLIMICVNITNIVVAWLLINGQFGLPLLGIRGAAIGAISGWAIGAILAVTRLLGLWPGLKHSQTIRVQFNLHPQLEYIKEMVRIGLPTFGEQMVFQTGLFFFARFVIGLGTVAYAGHSAIINIDSASFLPGMGIATATTVLVGQCLGAGRPALAERYTVAAWQMGLVFMGIMGLFFVFVPEFFLRLLVENETVVAEASLPLRIAGLFDPALATAFILIGALRGAGDTKWPMYARLLGTWGLRVGLAALFIGLFQWGLVGSRLAMGLDSVAVALFIYWRFRSGRWKQVWADKKARTGPASFAKTGPANLVPVAPAPLDD